jgi:gas vesicle protein
VRETLSRFNGAATSGCQGELYFPTTGATISSVSNWFHGGLIMADDSNSILWFLAGLGVGAAVGVLYAPRSGSETRETLRARADEGREFVSQRARKAREQANDLVDKGREVAKQQKEQFKSAYEAGRQAYHEATAADGGASKNL